MSERIAQENKMGYMPVPKLLMNMGIPMMVSMLVQALYNVVDGIFVSYISEDALGAHRSSHISIPKLNSGICAEVNIMFLPKGTLSPDTMILSGPL